MHFWIDKRSQACGFNGRYQVPPSISGYGRNQRNLCGTFYPKPMVTPVHRFQSIESVANNGLRYARSPGYHPRLQCPPANHYNGSSSSNTRVTPQMELMSGGPAGHTPTLRTTAKLKCGVWIFFAVITFLLAGAKYYFHGINIGVEALVFCSLLVIVLIIGGLISLCEAITYSPTNSPVGEVANPTPMVEQNSEEAHHNQVPTTTLVQNSSELPPPPYHIAIMLVPHDMNSIDVIGDSPPPSYDKAVK